MKKNYIIKCFVIEPTSDLQNIFRKLIIEHHFIIDKGWENGPHIKLRGTLSLSDLESVKEKINKHIDKSLTEFDEKLFLHKYTKIADQLGKGPETLFPLIKSKVLVEEEEHIFENKLDDTLFKEINYIFDSYFCNDYFKKTTIYEVIEEILKFSNQLSLYERSGSKDAYNCHLSHFISFHHNLSDKDKYIIEQKFQKDFNNDLKKGVFNVDSTPTLLTINLVHFFNKIKELVEQKKLDFFMPYNKDILKRKLPHASKIHKETFSEKNIHYFLYNEVIIVNRWITNALYKKLLLLGLRNIDRFYLNYVISNLYFSENELKKSIEA